jgi:predicted nucleic acid-binding Zn ribbon protein
MENLKPVKNQRTCVVCEKFIYGRSDKVFCDIKCKNKYHAELGKSQKTIARETFKILTKNWSIIATLFGEGVDELHINKIELARHGFDFTTVSGVEISATKTTFNIFEYTWFHKSDNEIRITFNNKQEPISPFIFKRWQNRYSADTYPAIISDTHKQYQQRNSS